MTPTEVLRRLLDERGIVWVAISEGVTEYAKEGVVYRAYEVCGGLEIAIITSITTDQAIAATVGAEKLDTSELWPEWEQVLFANVTDEVAQDNLNECFHELLEKAATAGGTCRLVDNESGPDMHCTVCGREVDDEYRYFMERWGYSRCPHCGRRIEVGK